MGSVVIGVTACFALVAADPSFRRVFVVDGKRVIAESAAGGKGPFLVARQPVMSAGLA
jgi:hypothetical protein